MKKKTSKKRWEDILPACPPEDYKGSVGRWMIKLQEMGLWNGWSPEWYGDVWIDKDVYWKILEECEEE